MPAATLGASASASASASDRITRFTNCLVLRHGRLQPEDLWISSSSGKVLDSQAIFYERQVSPERVVDLAGKIVSAGFLEVQINGAYGFDFSVVSDDTAKYAKGVRDVSQRLISTGVTAYLPTLTSQRSEVYHKVIRPP